MTQTRSARHKTFSLEEASNLKPPDFFIPSETLTRKHKVQPALKNRKEAFFASVAGPTTRLPTTRGKKRKLGDLQDEKLSNAPPPDPPDRRSGQTVSKTKLKGKSRAKDGKTTKQDQEKRLRRYRDKPPQSFLEKLHRAQTQRMIVIGRTRTDTDEFPREEIDIVGSTGNIYKVTIGQITSCTCPDHQKGNECKHKVYAMHTVLKAPENLVYQLAYLSSELREIFRGAPPIPTNTSSSNGTDGKRKPVEGECPICYQDYGPQKNELVWCKAACGQNIHKSCFAQWMAAQEGTAVRCVFCRTPWEVDYDDVQTLTKTRTINAEGYVNVADQFGMSGVRDYSVYNRFSRHAMGLGWSRLNDEG